MPENFILKLLAVAATAAAAMAQTPDQVLVVVNRQSPASREIGEYYLKKRAVPLANLCTVNTAPTEKVSRAIYLKEIEAPIAAFLKKNRLQEKILYVVTTIGVPLIINGDGDAMQSTISSVDSELTLLYQRMKGVVFPIPGAVANPFFRQRDAPFQHPQVPIYLVTRLAAYDMAEMKGLVDKALAARNTGHFVIDLRANEDTPGNQWLRTAALLLPRERVVQDETAKIVTGEKGVIGYASWGSNDPDRKQRLLHFTWLPGGIATEFVSTDGRTFLKPPENWQLGSWSKDAGWFAGSPQTLTADYIHEGATGASGQVYEPYLGYCPRPEFVLPAYYSGRTLAESFYMGIPGLSWMNIVIGDPLARLIP